MWPELVAELEPLVSEQEGEALAAALASSQVSGLCGCGQSDCFTFSTRSTDAGEYDESIIVNHAPGFVTLDVDKARRLLGVEILGWESLEASYLEFRKRVRRWR